MKINTLVAVARSCFSISPTSAGPEGSLISIELIMSSIAESGPGLDGCTVSYSKIYIFV